MDSLKQITQNREDRQSMQEAAEEDLEKIDEEFNENEDEIDPIKTR